MVVRFWQRSRTAVLAHVRTLAEQGLRAIAIASRPWTGPTHAPTPDGEANLVYAGLCAFADPPKATAPAAIARLQAMGIRLKILSGNDPVVVGHMIMLDSDLGVVADGVEEGRRTFANILKYVRMGRVRASATCCRLPQPRCSCHSCRYCRRRSCSTTFSTTWMIGFYVAYGVCALAMVAVLWTTSLASVWTADFVLVFLTVATAIPGLALWIRQRGRRPVSPMLARFASIRALVAIVGEAPKRLLVDRRLIVRVAGVNGLVFLADAASLMVCFLALGQPVGFAIAFVAVMTASMIATLGPIPLGLGTFEAGATGMLTLTGVPVEPALAATLLLRLFTLWLPLVPGFLLIRATLRIKAARIRTRA